MTWKLTALVLLLPAVVFGADIRTYTARLPLGDWEPSVKDAVNAIDVLRYEYRLQGTGAPVALKWHDYRFQYYGTREKGRKLLFLNAFCSSWWDKAPDWKERLVMVKDGGRCFFQATFDVDAGTIVSFNVNGEA